MERGPGTTRGVIRRMGEVCVVSDCMLGERCSGVAGCNCCKGLERQSCGKGASGRAAGSGADLQEQTREKLSVHER